MLASCHRHLFAAVVVIGLSSTARSESPPAAVADMPESETVSDGKPLDILGVRLGAPFQEAVAALEATAGQKPEIITENTGIQDGRGNAASFAYPNYAALPHGMKSGETMAVYFSTSLTGHRVQRVRRDVSFHQNEANLPETQKALLAKYGTPSLIVQGRRDTTILYVWLNGQRVGAGEKVRDGDSRIFKPPFVCAASFPDYISYSYGSRHRREKGCDTVIRIKINHGARDDLAKRMSIEMMDIKRFWNDKAVADAWLEAELQKATASKTGTAAPEL